MLESIHGGDRVGGLKNKHLGIFKIALGVWLSDRAPG